MNHTSKALLALCVLLAIVASVGIFSWGKARGDAALPQASTKEVFVAAAAQVTLTRAIEVRAIALTSLGTVTLILEDNVKTVRDYDYTVSLYVDGVLTSTSTIRWTGGIGPLPQQRIIPLWIPEGTLNWTRITAVVTP